MDDLIPTLAQHWGLEGAQVSPLGGGMNSRTWRVDHAGVAYVAKSVPPAQVADLESGCAVARTLAAAGLRTGRPVATRDGRLVLAEGRLALLEHVPGRELRGETDEEQEWMAVALAEVHAVGGAGRGPSVATFGLEWLSPDMPGVASHPWLVTAVDGVRAETDELALTWSVLHTDPAPGAFIRDDEAGVTGLVDWAGARRGPVLYDVASAVMYLGGADRAATFLRTYMARSRSPPASSSTSTRSGGSARRSKACTSRGGWPPTTSPVASSRPRT